MLKNVKKTIKILEMLQMDGPTEQGVESRARD